MTRMKFTNICYSWEEGADQPYQVLLLLSRAYNRPYWKISDYMKCEVDSISGNTSNYFIVAEVLVKYDFS